MSSSAFFLCWASGGMSMLSVQRAPPASGTFQWRCLFPICAMSPDHDIAAFKSGRALQLVFADATNGDTTYSVGRFLFLAPNADGTI